MLLYEPYSIQILKFKSLIERKVQVNLPLRHYFEKIMNRHSVSVTLLPELLKETFWVLI